MAITADVVGVRMEADTAAYINNIKIAESTFLKSMQKMGAEAVIAGNASAIAFQKTGSAATKSAKDVKVLENSMKSLNGTTGNVAAQFNDIGVQLAGGQSPLLIALQQGTQLNQVFNQLKEGGGGIGASLLGAFTQILNPISLATIGIIALGGYAIQYFMSIITDGDKANLTLEEQNTIIRNIAERWGEAVPALKAYVDELDRAKNAAEDAQGIKILEKEAFADASKQLDAFSNKYQEVFFLAKQAARDNQPILGEVGKAYENLTDKIEKGTAKVSDLQRVQDALNAAAKANAIPILGEVANAYVLVADGIAQAIKQAQSFNQVIRPVVDQIRGMNQPLAYSNDGGVPDGTIVPTPDRRPSDLSQYPGGGFSKPKAAKKDTEDSYESFTRKIKEQTAATQAETDALAKLNPLVTDYGYAADAARLYQEGLNAAKKAGIELSPAEQEQLRLLTEGLALVRQEQAKLEEEQKKVKKSFEEWNETAKSAVGGLIDDMLSGASAAEILKNALGKVADQLIEIGLNKVFDSKSGILSALFSSFTGGSSGGDPWAGKRANGGPVQAGKAYWVGERGPEPFIPDRAGSILPNVPNIGAPGGSGGPGGQITIRTFMDDNGTWQQVVENIAGDVAIKHVKKSQAGEITRLPGNLKAANQRGMIQR